MASVRVFLQRITPSERLALPSGKRGQVLLRNNIFVHAVKATLYDAKLHKPSYVDIRHDFEPSLAVNHDPLLDALPRRKRRHEADEKVIADPGPAVGHIAGALVDDAVDVADEVVDARPGRVARAEEEDVEEEDGVVVEQVADGDLGEVEGDGGLVGDAADVGDAVDFGDDFLEGDVPCWVDDFGEFGSCDGDVPAFDGGGVGVVGEELHVDGVCFV